MREAVDLLGSDRVSRRDDRLLLPRLGRKLGGAELTVREEDGVRERAAHIDAENRHAESLSSWGYVKKARKFSAEFASYYVGIRRREGNFATCCTGKKPPPPYRF